MGVLPLIVLGGGIYVLTKHRKAKKCRRAMQAQAVFGVAPGTTAYNDRAAGENEKHKTWCNGTCGGRCMANDVQYTPDETPREQNPGREDYFDSVGREGLQVGVVSNEEGMLRAHE